ncbi:DUF2029 domain-containing protein [Candidatus Sumerlaeota bacterium]|nr:DUF2029 domain-containing protein [Candidatus Sumerlaeota bacterium]
MNTDPNGAQHKIFIWNRAWKWLLLFAVVTTLAVIKDSKLSSDPAKWKIRGDLTNYSLAAAKLEKTGGNPYNVDELGKNYKYLPFNMMILAPLTIMPIPLAQGVWVGVNVMLLLLALQAHQELSGKRFSKLAWIFMLLIAGRFIWDNIKLGQWNLPVYSLTVIGLWIILCKRKTWLGALILGLGILKYMPVFFTVYFIAKRQWKTAGKLALALFFWVLIAPSLWFGPVHHYHMLKEWKQQGAARVDGMVSHNVLVGHSLMTSLQTLLCDEKIISGGYRHDSEAGSLNLSSKQAKTVAMTICGFFAMITLALFWFSGDDVSPRPELLMELGAMFMLLLICSPQARFAHLITTTTAILALGGMIQPPIMTDKKQSLIVSILLICFLLVLFSSSYSDKLLPGLRAVCSSQLHFPTLLIVLLWGVLCAFRLSFSLSWTYDASHSKNFNHKWLIGTYLVLSSSIALVLIGGSITFMANPFLIWSHQFHLSFTGAAIALFSGLLIIIVLILHYRSIKSSKTLFLNMAIVAVLLSFVQYSAINPAMSHMDTSLYFNKILNNYIHDQGSEQRLGVLGDNVNQQKRIDGQYTVDRIKPGQLLPSQPDQLPELLLTDKLNAAEQSQSLSNLGYRKVYEDIVADEHLILFKKSPNQQMLKQPGFFRFAFTGDTGIDNSHNYAVAKQIYLQSKSKRITSVLLLGDNAYAKGDYAKVIQACFLSPYESIIADRIPIHAVLGNHDYYNGFVDDEIKMPQFGMHGMRYYTETFGDDELTFFCIDSEIMRIDPVQIDWLKNQLSLCTSKWKILLMHHPILGSELAHGPSKSRSRILTPIIQEYGVDFVFAGHNHFYERSKVYNDTVYITTGGGGKLDGGKWPEFESRAFGYNKQRSFMIMDVTPDGIALTA